MVEQRKDKLKVDHENWHSNAIKQLFQAIESDQCVAAAIGLDMAASETKWGFSVITINEDYTKGQLRLLLPHTASDSVSQERYAVMPNLNLLKQVLKNLRSRKIISSIAVDTPFGWPTWHGDFTHNWSATDGYNGNLRDLDGPSKRKDFERRLTDHELKKKIGSPLLAVGADKIASGAYEWAYLRTKISEQIDTCDIGLGLEGEPIVTVFETYPAGFVRLNFPTDIKYKSGEKETKKRPNPRTTEKIRRDLLAKVKEVYALSNQGCESQIDQACSDSKSDAFDGFLSALTAWDYLRWRKYGEQSHATTTPKALLRRDPTTDEINTIEKEGWILIRSSDLKEASLLQSTSVS